MLLTTQKKKTIESDWRQFEIYWEWLEALPRQLRVIFNLSQPSGTYLLHLPYYLPTLGKNFIQLRAFSNFAGNIKSKTWDCFVI